MTPRDKRIALMKWRHGSDTLAIAAFLRIPESEVYNALARHRERQTHSQ